MPYLFPCTCGKDISLEPRQAGEEITCECGLKHTAPTMREIRQLPSTGDNTAPTRRWSATQGALFSGGGALVLVGISTLAVLLMHRSKLQTEKPQLDQQKVVEHFDQWLSEPDTSLIAWNAFTKYRLPQRNYTLRWIEHRKLAARNFWQCMLAAGLIAIGVVLAVVSVFLPPPDPKRRPQRGPPAKKPA